METIELYIETDNENIENDLKFSNLSPLISAEKDYDIRDSSIDSILTNRYRIYLSNQDYEVFFNLLDKREIICDLSIDKNRKIVGIRSEWEELQKYTENYILKNLNDDYKFLRIKTLDNLSLDLFENHPDLFNWDNISWLNLPLDFIKRNKNRLNWEILTPVLYDNVDFEPELLKKGSLLGSNPLLDLEIFKEKSREYKINSLLNDIWGEN